MEDLHRTGWLGWAGWAGWAGWLAGLGLQRGLERGNTGLERPGADLERRTSEIRDPRNKGLRAQHWECE